MKKCLPYIVLLIFAHWQAVAQKKTVLDTLVSLNFKGQTLKDCIHKIEADYPGLLTYNNQDLEAADKRITGSFSNKPLSVVLGYCFRNTRLDYRYYAGQIIVFQKRKPLTISGFLKDAQSGEVLIGASIYIKDPFTGTSTNAYGFYSLSLPQNKYELYVSFVAKETKVITFDLRNDTVLNMMVPVHVNLEEVEVKAQSGAESEKVGSVVTVNRMNIEQIKKMPALLGEPDLLRSVHMQPGVQTMGEVASGYFVRGGSLSQNLVLLDEAPVYNPTHLMGVVSAFNTDMVKSADLYKGGIPAGYQAGASSVLDVHARDGNNETFHVGGGIGLISSRLYLEGPLKKGGGSFFLAGRKSIATDYLLNSGFYDLNFKISDNFGSRDRLFISAYRGSDYFKYDTSTTSWQNTTFTVRHNHVYSGKLFSNTTLVYSKFMLSNGMLSDDKQRSASTSQSVENYMVKYALGYFPRPNTTINAGVYFNKQLYSPFNMIYKDGSSDTTTNLTLSRNVFEAGIFADVLHELNPFVSIYVGVRAPVFHDNTTGKFFFYDERTLLLDSMSLKPTTFKALEPRLGLRFLMNEKQSIKVSYNHINQFQQQFLGGSLFYLAQVWLPSSSILKPQVVDQLSLGYFLQSKQILYSVEGFYKHINNVSDFRDGTQLFGNDYLTVTSLINIESLLEQGKAKAYGMEASVSKTEGRLTGWLNYTLAKTMYTIKAINNGNPYPANFDNRHTISLGTVFRITKKWECSAAFNYKSGRAFSFPDSYYTLNGKYYGIITERNKERTPAYHRLDVSLIYKPETKHKKFESTWIFSVINVYNKFNPTFYYMDGKDVTAYAIFPILPSIGYNFKF